MRLCVEVQHEKIFPLQGHKFQRLLRHKASGLSVGHVSTRACLYIYDYRFISIDVLLSGSINLNGTKNQIWYNRIVRASINVVI